MTEGPADVQNHKRKRGRPKNENTGGMEKGEIECPVEGRSGIFNIRNVWNVKLKTGEEDSIGLMNSEEPLGKDGSMKVRNKNTTQKQSGGRLGKPKETVKGTKAETVT